MAKGEPVTSMPEFTSPPIPGVVMPWYRDNIRMVRGDDRDRAMSEGNIAMGIKVPFDTFSFNIYGGSQKRISYDTVAACSGTLKVGSQSVDSVSMSRARNGTYSAKAEWSRVARKIYRWLAAALPPSPRGGRLPLVESLGSVSL